MRNLNILLSAGLLGGMSVTAAAEATAVSNLTLAAAVELALQDNPGLKSLRERWDAMRERPAQAGTLPNPMFTYSGMDAASGGDWPNTGEKRFMVQQEFSWFGKRALREGIAVKDALSMQWELDSMTREIVMMVKEDYFDLHAVQHVIAITREEEAVVRRMVKAAETMYATGERTQVDVLKGVH